MTDLRKAAEMALEAMEKYCECGGLEDPIEALRQALAQGQEPVVWITPAGEGFRLRFERPTNDVPLGWEPLYTTPPKREWVGLTDEEIGWLWHNSPPNSHEYARAIEAKLKEKNT